MALTAATKTTTRTEYYAPGRVTSVNGGASAAQCSSISITTRRAPLRPTRADWSKYCNEPVENSGSCILGHEGRRPASHPFGTAGNVRRFRDMPIEFYFTPNYISRMDASSGTSRTRRALVASTNFALESIRQGL